MKISGSCLFVLALAAVSAAMPVAASETWVPVLPVPPGEKPVAAVSESADGLVIRLDVPGYRWEPLPVSGKTYTRLSVPDCGFHGETGEPSMPFYGLLLPVPNGPAISVETLRGSPRITQTGVTVYPQQPPEPDCGALPVPFEADEGAYGNDAWYPESPVRIAGDAVVRGQRFLFLEIHPLRHNPAREVVEAYPSLEVTLAFQGRVDREAEALKARRAKNAFPTLLVDADDPARDVAAPRSNPAGIEYLVIAHDTLAAEVEPLVQWKRLKGYTAEIVAMSTVGSTSSDIKTFLQNRYDADPDLTYVLLVGDHGQVPSEDQGGFVSDLYYSCLDGSDYFPDIVLGRISVQTTTDCANVVDKILNYDRTPDQDAWHGDFLMAALLQDYDDYNCVADRWFYETGTHAMHYVRDTIGMGIYTAATSDSLSCNPYSWRPDSYPHRFSGYAGNTVPLDDAAYITNGSTATQDVADAINAGVSIVQHRDHGGVTAWGDPYFGLGNIDALANGTRTPVVFSINCLTGTFNNGSGDCFAERFMKKYPGGCVGIVAATESSYSGYNDLITHGAYDCFWDDYDPANGINPYPHSWRPAEAFMYAKYHMYNWEGGGSSTQYQFELFHWHGDPEMMVITDVPATPVVDLSCPIPTGTTTLSVDCDVEGALVAVTEGGVLIGRAFVSGGTAEVILDPPPSIPTDYDVVVTAHNTLPYEGTCPVIPACANNPYVDVVPDGPVMICTGSGALMTANLSGGTGPFTYQWTRDGVDIAGATDAVHTADDAGTHDYNCKVWGDGCADPAWDYPPTQITWRSDPDFDGIQTVTNPGESTCTLDLAWNAGTAYCGGPLQYHIYRGTAPGFTPGPSSLVTTVTGTSHSDEDGLDSGTTYYYVVRAEDAGSGMAEANTVELSGTPFGPGGGPQIWLGEDFDGGGFPPSGWNVVDNLGNGDVWDLNTVLGDPNMTNGTGDCAAVGRDSQSGTAWDSELWTPSIDLTSASSASVSYQSNFQDWAGNGEGWLDVSVDGGTGWTNLWYETDDYGPTFESFDLTAYVGETIILRWRMAANSGTTRYFHIDDVVVEGVVENPCVTGSGCPNNPTVDVLPDGPITLCEGTAQVLTASLAGGVAPFQYQWTEDGAPISGATGSTCSVSGSGTFIYNCLVRGSGCTEDESDAAPTLITWNACLPDVVYQGIGSLTQLCGDGDGVVEPGEEWRVTVELTNGGTLAAGSVQATLQLNAGSAIGASFSATDPNPASFGDIAAGGTASASFSFCVDGAAVCVDDITFDVVDITWTGGGTPPNEQVPAFGVTVGTVGGVETPSQVTDPLQDTGAGTASDFDPTTIPSAVSATLAYDGSCLPGTVTTLFGPDDDPYNSGNWTTEGASGPSESHCGHSGPYYQIDGEMTLIGSLDASGYADITVTFDFSGLGSASMSRLSLDWYDGTDWQNDFWTGHQSDWVCGQAVVLPPGAAHGALKIRFRWNSNQQTNFMGLDSISIVGNEPPCDWTDDVTVEFFDLSGWQTLKAPGAPDANPYDVAGHYHGAGTYRVRITNAGSGTAEMTDGQISITGVGDCDVSSCPACGGTVPGEVGPGGTESDALTWSDPATLVWPLEPSATGYALYRGIRVGLPGVLDGDPDSCLKYQGSEATAADADDPTAEAGRFFFYVVVGTNSFGAGSAGNATAGPREMNDTGACP